MVVYLSKTRDLNVFEEILKINLPKVVNLFNLDRFSRTYGYADREYWGWKIKDFSNGTMQGAIHALTIAYKLNVFTDKDLFFEILDASFSAVEKIKSSKGSLSEAFPVENSFCVTAIAAFDMLSALDLIQDELTGEKKNGYLAILEDLILFITRYDEVHAIISNHLATGVAAVVFWNKLTGDTNARYKELLDIIYSNQSKEGWYKEYDGADPGYQTLCTYYLAETYLVLKDEKLLQSLKSSIDYLSYFVQSNGSIGGLYGSRNTEVFYPGGFLALKDDIPACNAIISRFLKGLESGVHIKPQHIDIGNYVPLLNSYAYAARFEKDIIRDQSFLPCDKIFELTFPRAGIFIKSTQEYYCILNFKKGGTVKIYDKILDRLDCEDGGLFGQTKTIKFSTQFYDDSIDFKNNSIQTSFYKINESYPGPLDFIILRFLALTVFKNTGLGNRFKKMIVRMLMTNKNKLKGSVARKFVFEENKVRVEEKIEKPNRAIFTGHIGKSRSIHMASSGYTAISNTVLHLPQRIGFYEV
jgi:hypothetical protein